MSTELHPFGGPEGPSEEDTRLAREGGPRLAVYLHGTETVRMQILQGDGVGETVAIPSTALQLLVEALTEMGRGNAVTLISRHAELTTQQAADFLNVSRPYLVRLLQAGEIPFHKVGTHHRLRFEDVSAYKNRINHARREVLAELTAEAQALGLGY